MMRGWISLACGLVLLAGWRATWADERPATPGEYELEVGGKRIAVEPGKPAEVETPKGEKLRIVLHVNPERSFDKYGFAFRYPREMQLGEDEGEGFRTVTVEAAESPLVMFQIYPNAPGGEPLIDALIEQFREAFGDRGVPEEGFRQGKATRKLGEFTLEGKSLRFEVLGQAMELEAFALKLGDGALAVVFQHDRADGRIAKKLFETVAGSFKLDAKK